MPSYICQRCNFKTSQRANFKRHLTRKNLCDPVNKDIPIKHIADSYGIEFPSTDISSVAPNVTLKKRVTVTRNPSPNTEHTPISNKNEQNVNHRHHCDIA